MNQIELHKKIDEILLKNPDDVKRDEVSDLISVNFDACDYFYFKADERWLDWLWKNGFLDVIKRKMDESTEYRMLELDYLVKISETVPIKIVDIMMQIHTSQETFNPEVIDRFLRICRNLSAEQLARLVQKVLDEKWIPLMGKFNHSGFEYEAMLKTLTDAKDYKSVLILAEAILTLCQETKKSSALTIIENPFYFNDLSYIKIFEYLVAIDDKYVEQAFSLCMKAMTDIVRLGDETKNNDVFSIEDSFPLFDVDFFTLESGEKKHLSYRDDVRELAATIKVLISRLISEKHVKADVVRKIYNQYIQDLPKSKAMWRLQLFVLSLRSDVFNDELKNAFFRLFEVDHYFRIITTEYEKTLQKGFSVLLDDDKHEYVKKAIKLFTKNVDNEKDQERRISNGSRIFSVVADDLTKGEREKIKEAKFIIDYKYEPQPSIGVAKSGSIRSRGVLTQEVFSKTSIIKIIEKLKDEWSPEKLREQNTNDDFLNPLNADGIGNQLRFDITKRPQDYINNAKLFLERDTLDQHYTFSFLRGIQEFLSGNKTDISSMDWKSLIDLCITIKKFGEEKPFSTEERKHTAFSGWLSGWKDVHSAMADVIQELINEKDGKIAINFTECRDQLFEIISYLLKYPDPALKDEKVETAKSKTKSPDDTNYIVNDPFSMAINTVRGRAFQAFVLFVYQDGKKFDKMDSSKISAEVKELYETILKYESTRTIMFMFGYYLPSFYFRDKKWIKKLLPQIFPKDNNLFTSAWEGYLINDLYIEMFFDSDMQRLYNRGLDLIKEESPRQKYFRNPDKGIAIHFALAFVHYEDFDFKHPLFKKFWNIKNSKRHKEFISFIGKHSISRNMIIDLEKLKKFWDWAIKNCDADVLSEFGFWINVEHNAFGIKWLAERIRQTLEKTNGYIQWEHNLMSSLKTFAKEAPEDTLIILRLLFLEEIVKHKPTRIWLRMDKEVFDAFKELYENEKTKERVYLLVDDLIREGGGMLWGLKGMFNEN